MQKHGAVTNEVLNTTYKLFVEGINQPLYCSACQTVLEALTSKGIFLEANCGGRGSCGKCQILVLDGQVNGPDGLPAKPLQNNTHLACRIYPASNIIVKVKQIQVSAKGNVATVFAADGPPLVKKIIVIPVYPTLSAPSSLQELFGHSLPTSIGLDNICLLQQLGQVMDRTPEQMTVVMIGNEIIAVEAGDTTSALFGLAFDIGTTTVVGMLVDINAYKVVATFSETNPQAAFGADVISRINAAKTDTGLAAQTRAIRQCLDRIIGELCAAAKVDRHQIYAATIAGNSTMMHLLLAISPLSLIRQPYVAAFKTISPFASKKIELDINPNAKVVLLPNITSFIGADTTAAILAVDQDISSDPLLMVDLGTNGEIVFGNREKIFTCSTAVGPAFEGAHIRDGMRATVGAIEDVVIDTDVQVKTIGGHKPVGICGSGIIKAIAQLLKKKIITTSGRFNWQITEVLPPNLAQRLIKKGAQWEFVLVEGKNSATDADISVTQADIRQIQLVKSAICTGIQVLIGKSLPIGEVPVFLAGAFGNYIDVESAITIGLLPGFTREQVRSVGNAAGTGAIHTLLSQRKLKRCWHIANEIDYVELTAEPDFQKQFLANLVFPEMSW